MQEAVSEVPVANAAATQSLVAKLQLPARELSSLSCGCTTERQLCAWLEKYDLQPYHPADQKRLAGLLCTLIDEVGQWRAPGRLRLAMLEQLREYTLASVDAMAIRRSALAKAQTAELRKAVLAAMRLLVYLGSAYASTAEQLLREGGLVLLVRERRARGLQRAVDSYRRVTRLSALFGLAPPRNCWRNMQLLLQLAQSWKLAARTVKDPQHPKGRDSTASAYLQAALFACANPIQLAAQEQEQLWDKTHDWCRAAQIVGNYNNMSNGLLASLALDQPPVPANRLGSCKVDLRHFSAPRGWKVDLSGVLELLQKQLGRRHDPFADRVRQGWAEQAGRSERRTPLQQTCEIAIGIASISFQLRGVDGAPSESPESFSRWAEPSGAHLCLDVDSVDFASGRTVTEYDVVLPTAPILRSEMRRRRQGESRQQRERYRPELANILNCSGHGVGLSLPLSTCDKLRVGDLVGVHLHKSWQVAVVRWQHTLPDHSRAGVEILAQEAMPVQVQRHTSAGQLSAPIAGLLVQVAGEEKPALILPVPLFKCYDTVELLTPSQSQPVTLQRQTLTTGSFARFEFV